MRNATVEASDLVLKRDIYYTQYPGRYDYEVVWDDHRPRNPTELFDFLSDPSRFSGLGRLRYHDYEIGQDRFFMLGDNSPRSKDSRGWGTRGLGLGRDDRAQSAGKSPGSSSPARRSTSTGRTACRSGPIFRLGRDFRFPFRPYFERMKWIR